MGKDIAIGKDAGFTGYLATPAGGKGPGVVVIQEIFGINGWVRSVADMFAAEGYMALAPDLFWRLKPGIQLDPTDDGQFKQGLGYMGRFDFAQGLADIQSSITMLRGMSATGKVGNLGFCMGGLLAFLTAANSDTDATASYYGGGTNTKLDEVAKIKNPTILHLAGDDDYMPKAAQDLIVEKTKSNKNVTVHIYPGAHHGFCRSTDPRHFKADACKEAHGRTLALFKETLQ
jgi:carboxymethylenebutenolidase